MAAIDRINKRLKQFEQEEEIKKGNLTKNQASMQRIESLQNELKTNGKVDYVDTTGIAPVRTTTKTSSKTNTVSSSKDDDLPWYKTLIKGSEAFNNVGSAFDDGYDFGDITKTLLKGSVATVKTAAYTTADIGLNAVEGVARVGEGVGTLLAAGGAQVLDWAGNDKKAQQVRNRIAGKEKTGLGTTGAPLSYWLNEAQKKVDKNSVIGKSGDEISSLIGYTGGLLVGGELLGAAGGTASVGTASTGVAANLGNVGVSVAGHTLNIPTLAFVGGASSGLTESYGKENVTDAQAWSKALGSGAIEGVTEGLFGMFGVGGSSLDDAAAKLVTEKFSSGIAKALASTGVKASGEALEEFLSYAGNQGLDLLIDKASKETSADFYNKWDWEEVGEQMGMAFISAGLSQGGSTVVNANTQANIAIKNVEQELGRQLTENEKKSVKDQVLSAVVSDNEIKQEDLMPTQNQTNKTTTQQQQTNLNTKPSSNTLNNVNTQQNVNTQTNLQVNAQNLENTVQNKQQVQNNNVNLSEAFIEEINNKTIEANKNNPQVEYMSVDELLKTQDRKGYRTNEEVTKLENSIRENGITSPIKIVKDSNGNIKIDNGNHRLEIAKKLGLKNVPVKVVESNVENYENNLYNNSNKEDLQYIEGDFNGSISNSEGLVSQNEGSRTKQGNSANNSSQLENERAARGNDNISGEEQGYNNESSSNTTYTGNTKELDNSSFSNAQVMTEEEYLASKGYPFMGYSEAGLHNSSQHDSKRGRQEQVKMVQDKAVEYDNKRAELRKEYQEKVKNGEIRKPTSIEERLKTAQGNEDNPAVQAARRNLERMGIDWKTGEKIADTTQDEIAPLKQELTNLTNELKATIKDTKKEIKSLTKEINNVKSNVNDTVEEIKALTEEDLPMLEQQLREAPLQDIAPIRNNLTQAESQELDNLDNMPFDLTQEEAARQEELTNKENNYVDAENNNVVDPFEERDFEDIGKQRNVNAYQYDNPEVQPYFKVEAERMLQELKETIKGERILTGDTSQFGDANEQKYVGIERQTSESIAYLKDNTNYSYEDIQKGLEAIIKDHGSENKAVSKRIEFILNERLMNGYKTVDGYDIPANKEYINVVQGIEATKAYSESPIGEAPNNIIEDIAPVKEKYETIKSNYNESKDDGVPMLRIKPDKTEFNKKVAESNNEIKNELGYIPKDPTRAESYEYEDSTENQKIAEILTNEPKTESQKNKRKWAIFKANVLDKGAVFEDLSLKNKNRDLMGKWDYTLTSEARAQNVIGNGHTEYNADSKSITKTSKSLNEIVAEVNNTGLTKEFYEYVYHKHNVDRMNLESRAKAKMIELDRQAATITDMNEKQQIEAELKQLSKTVNKPVFGYDVTSEQSQEIVNQYEFSNPEFMDFAQDVYDYVNADRQQLVKEGVISQETADLWNELYPHYVPIRRANHNGNAIDVPLDTNRTGINAPIKKATGGNGDILPLFDTMAMRTLQTYKATAKNSFGVELKNTLGNRSLTQNTNLDEMIDSIDNQEGLLQEGKNGANPTFTVFENGEKTTFEITQDMYDALKPLSDSSILSKTITPLNKASNFHRGVLTEYNPVFMLTNAVKDAQDVLMNSQHAAKTYSKVPEAYAQLLSKGYWYQEYIANGGEQNSYFDSQENTFKSENKGIAKLLDIPPLSTISKLNNFIEMTPRLAEYIASRESGRSVEVSMLDAARVTTNFKAGGNLTKFLNRNGATFLNASVQGAMQQVRNVREAKMNGLKGWTSLAAKTVAAGLPALLLNGLVWKDDEEYDELSDYVKQNYYIVAKKEDGTFIRIPKGRTVAVIQNAFEQISNASSGNDEVDLKEFIDLVLNNLAPNNPIDNNILAPIMQVANNKSWFGNDIVPTRLQDSPVEEQYDESTDLFSRWFGETFNVSPMKVSYLLNQYSGGVGDVVLPMMTPKATSDADTLGEQLLAPLKDKFTTNAVMNNQNVSDFYDTKEELAKNVKKSDSTDEDLLKNKFINSINSQLSDLYNQKREIQNSSLSNSEKYSQVLEVQKQINELSKAALNDYKDVNITGNYATVGDIQFKLNESENGTSTWTKLTDKQIEKQEEVSNSLGIDASTYWSNKSEYDYAYENPSKYATATAITDYETYKKYTSDIYDIKADKDENGKSISGSRKEKVFDYINSLDLGFEQRIMLAKLEYPSYDEYNYEIIEYLNNNSDISFEEEIGILQELGFDVDKEGNISW